jgi:hypothetical protein
VVLFADFVGQPEADERHEDETGERDAERRGLAVRRFLMG